MARVRIDAGRLRVEIEPELGAGVAGLWIVGPGGRLEPILRPAPASPAHFNEMSSYTLAPWSNRIAGARFLFAGREHRLRADWRDGTAIHGVVKDRPWRLLDRSPVSVRLGFDSRDHAGINFPFPFAAVIRYELSEGTFTTELTIRNTGEGPMPAGCGFHPYFMRRLWDNGDECVVRCRVSGRYPCAGMIPTGPARPDAVTAHLASGRPLGALELDDVFAGFDGRASVEWPASGVVAALDCSPNLAHVVVYSPLDATGAPRDFLCVEPVSMVNDGFNLMARGREGTGVVVLEPGASLEVAFELSISSG